MLGETQLHLAAQKRQGCLSSMPHSSTSQAPPVVRLSGMSLDTLFVHQESVIWVPASIVPLCFSEVVEIGFWCADDSHGWAWEELGQNLSSLICCCLCPLLWGAGELLLHNLTPACVPFVIIAYLRCLCCLLCLWLWKPLRAFQACMSLHSYVRIINTSFYLEKLPVAAIYIKL